MKHRIVAAIASEASLDDTASIWPRFRAFSYAMPLGLVLCVFGCAEEEKAAPVVDINAAVVEAKKEPHEETVPATEPSLVAPAPINSASAEAAPTIAPALSASVAPTVKNRPPPTRPPIRRHTKPPYKDFRDNLFN